MKKIEDDIFTGFSEKTIEFLNELKLNNNKVWFEAHRRDYEELLLEPMKKLVMELSEFMLTIDSYFVTVPAVDKTISRIYRDTRFSKDKSPYRANMWLVFKRRSKDWKVAPAYFFEVFPDFYRYGMGFYNAPRDFMDKFREEISNKPNKFLKIISSFSKENLFELKGEKYKRIIDSSKPEKIQDWYQRKTFYLVCNREIKDALFNRALVDDLMSGFSLLAPLYQFLWKIRGEKPDY